MPEPTDPNVTADLPTVPTDGGTAAFVPGEATVTEGTLPQRVLGTVSVPGYEIESVLGRGGMGVVYKARHLKLKRTVALKMILAGDHASERELTRFRIEAEAVARLQHPNIVQIHDIGAADGVPYCALEFIDGGTLATRLADKSMPPSEAAKLVETLARAMQLAHSRNVVHRDLKPANILLAGDGVPKITDFGLARRTDSDSGETQAGAIMGTPAYMAPEQAGRASEAGPAADVYALGAILYECLTGRPPFAGATLIETLDRVRNLEPVSPARVRKGVPLDLETICLKCLRKEPENRYSSAAELADELVRYQRGEPILARPVSHLERATKWVRRNPLLAGAMATALLVLVAGIVVSTLFAFEADRQATAEKETSRQLGIEKDRVGEALAQVTEEKKEKEKGRQLERARDNLVTSQLLRVGGLVSREPLAALQLLHDRSLCPIEARDHAWHLFENASRRRLLRRFLPPPELPVEDIDQFTSVAFSPDGRTLAAGGRVQFGPIVQIWDVTTGKELVTLKGVQDQTEIGNFDFSPDGRFLAAILGTSTIQLWEVGTWKDVGKLTLENHTLQNIAFTPDGRTLVTGGGKLEANGEIKLWDVATRKVRDTLKEFKGPLPCIAISPDGRTLATHSGWGLGLGDRTIRLWNLETGEALATLTGHTVAVRSVTFSPDGRTLLSSGGDTNKIGEIKLWDLATKRERFAFPVTGHDPYTVRYSPDGLRIASSGQGDMRLWDAHTGQLLASFQEPAWTNGSVTVLALAFSPDGRTLAAGSVSQAGATMMIDLWEVPDRLEATTLRGHTDIVRGLAYSPDGRTLASASFDRTVKLWDLATGQTRATLRGHRVPVIQVAFSPDGTTLLSGSTDSTMILWDAATGAKRATLAGLTGMVEQSTFSPDGRTLATCNVDNSVKILEVVSGKVLHTLPGEKPSIVLFSPDGRWLAAGSIPLRRIKLWDVASRTERAAFPIDEAPELRGLTFDREARTLIARLEDGSARRWDIETGKELDRSQDAVRPERTITQTTPDGRTELTYEPGMVGEVKPIRLWHVASGQERATLWGHLSSTASFCFSPDGRSLATGSHDHTIKLWDFGAGPFRTPLAWNGDRTGLTHSFSPDSRSLAVVEAGVQIQLWDVASASKTARLVGTPPEEFGADKLSLGFSADGRRLVLRDAADKAMVWDLEARRQVQEAPPAEVRSFPTSPDGRWGIHLDGRSNLHQSIWLIDRHRTPPQLPARTSRTNPDWHLEQSEDAERAGRWFAAGFHRGKLAELEPWDSALRLHEGQAWVAAEQRERATLAYLRAGFAAPPGSSPNPLRLRKPAPDASLPYPDANRMNPLPPVWEFSWDPVPGAKEYQIVVLGRKATKPLIDRKTPDATLSLVRPGFFIAPAQLEGWRWKVRAQVEGKWTEWSEERIFDVEPAK